MIAGRSHAIGFIFLVMAGLQESCCKYYLVSINRKYYIAVTTQKVKGDDSYAFRKCSTLLALPLFFD
jgi:hypothetical protein